ncbi:MAG: RimK family alpha-L-glutamate ligase [Pirellulaceae bacterium]|nr:RimK family alpha-L-glutamate ligase [Pirellulaceae bacterium]
MRFAVLSSPDSWYFQDLRRAAGDRHEVQCLPFDRLSAGMEVAPRSVAPSIHAPKPVLFSAPCYDAGDTPLNVFDAVLVRTMAPGTLEQVVFRMDVLGRIEQQGIPVVNPPRALEAAVDKYLASAKLQAAGLPTPPTIVCQTAEDAMDGFERLGGDVVVKPLFGSEGRGILRVEDPALALRVFKTLAQLGSVLYLQKFIPHDGFDIRVLVIGSQWFSIRRRHPSDWRTNISRGATAEPLTIEPEIVAMARQAAAVIGATIVGVDVLPGRDGRLYLLEVNAVPGWQGTARTLGIDVAALVLDHLESLAAAVDKAGTSR